MPLPTMSMDRLRLSSSSSPFSSASPSVSLSASPSASASISISASHHHRTPAAQSATPSSAYASSSSSPLGRRLSIDEDLRYHTIMASHGPSQPPHPPPYLQPTMPRQPPNAEAKPEPTAMSSPALHRQSKGGPRDIPPSYTCSVECEGVFERKMEIENATKRAEYRNWQSVYITLVGTALSVYAAKKDRGLGKKGGPSISPDNPPWIKRGKLLQQYSLMHADAGIAADYEKRRYVIRIRAETDQFLISCVELSTFIKWLDALFSAIDVAAPIEDRDFPRDQSIPRIQRIRWLRGAQHNCPGDGQPRQDFALDSPLDPANNPESRFILQDSQQDFQEENYALENDMDRDAAALANGNIPPPPRLPPSQPPTTTPHRPMLPIHGFSVATSSDYGSGKWSPSHAWTNTHDLLYAKMCYSVLLLRSPRKSPYVISKGIQWRVDWQTGQMTRVLPPQYNTGNTTPWEIIHTQNMRRR